MCPIMNRKPQQDWSWQPNPQARKIRTEANDGTWVKSSLDEGYNLPELWRLYLDNSALYPGANGWVELKPDGTYYTSLSAPAASSLSFRHARRFVEHNTKKQI